MTTLRCAFHAGMVSTALLLTLGVGAAEPTKTAASEPGWLGLGFTCHEKPKSQTGCDSLIVVLLAPEGPAARSGLRQSDIILEINGKATRFASHGDALNAFRKFRVGQTIQLKVFRDQKQIAMRVIAETPPAKYSGQWQKNEAMARENDARRARTKQDRQ